MSDDVKVRLRAEIERYALWLEQEAPQMAGMVIPLDEAYRGIAAHLRAQVRVETATPAELEQFDRELQERWRERGAAVPAPLFSIAWLGEPARLSVELAAASEMSFELRLDGLKYDKAIADVCRVAPAMLAYDEALMELYDSPHAAAPRIQQGWLHAIHDFVLRYKAHLVNVNVPFEQFKGTGQ